MLAGHVNICRQRLSSLRWALTSREARGGKAVRLFVGQKSICAFDFDIHTVYILLHEYAKSNRLCLSLNYSAEAQAWFSSLPSFARMKYTAPCVYETYWLFVLCLPKLKHTAMCIWNTPVVCYLPKRVSGCVLNNMQAASAARSLLGSKICLLSSRIVGKERWPKRLVYNCTTWLPLPLPLPLPFW